MERQSPPEANAEVEATGSSLVNTSDLSFSQVVVFSTQGTKRSTPTPANCAQDEKSKGKCGRHTAFDFRKTCYIDWTYNTSSSPKTKIEVKLQGRKQRWR